MKKVANKKLSTPKKKGKERKQKDTKKTTGSSAKPSTAFGELREVSIDSIGVFANSSDL